MPQIIDVKGIGELEFPDGMSDTDIEAAIKTHPDYKEPSKFSGARSSTVGAPGSSTAKTFINAAGPVAKTFNNVLAELGKGIPVVGALTENTANTPSNKEFEKNHPVISKGLNITGGVASTLPLVAAAAPAMGTGFGANALGQSAMFSGLNTADTLAKKGKNTTAEDLLWAIGTGTAGGLTGATLNKVISPNAIPKPELPPPPKPITTDFKQPPRSEAVEDILRSSTTPENLWKIKFGSPEDNWTGYAQIPEKIAKAVNNAKQAAHAEKVAGIQAGYKAQLDAIKGGKSSTLAKALWGLGGAGIGHAFGGPAGAMVGAFASPYAREMLPDLAGKYAANQVMASPTSQTILMSVMNELSGGLNNAKK